ncbi:response regulator [Azospirillum baldaniorum]|uniref:histidine kinase n=1 Tax=Azospirillum baldaniorum TaxID=1064539 RepID=A0A9P1NPP2_9PROT|nr:response regulator [Azospirillum baldaniorum]CCD00638.1 protein of unknown function [Azospirillum baldaniorum]
MSGGHILIVDDDTANIRALASVLEDRHEVRFATSGRRALELASADPPELVLLDVMMPGLDGYAVCRLLKTDPATADVPVIFITSLSSPEEEAFGLETGAVDYVTKPFSPAIVRARVATHLSLRRANRSLKDENEHLEALVRERTRKLAQAQREKMAALRQMVAGVAHEINTPIGVALGSASHLGDRVAAMTERLAANQLRRAELERFPGERRGAGRPAVRHHRPRRGDRALLQGGGGGPRRAAPDHRAEALPGAGDGEPASAVGAAGASHGRGLPRRPAHGQQPGDPVRGPGAARPQRAGARLPGWAERAGDGRGRGVGAGDGFAVRRR